MTDVLRLALDRRAELHGEVARIDDFIRMADALVRRLQPRAEVVAAMRDPRVADEPRPAYAQPATAALAAGPGAAAGLTPGVTRMNLMRRGAAAG